MVASSSLQQLVPIGYIPSHHTPHANPIHNIIVVTEEQVQNKFDWLGIKIYYSILQMLRNQLPSLVR